MISESPSKTPHTSRCWLLASVGFLAGATIAAPAFADDPCESYARVVQQFTSAAPGCPSPCTGTFAISKIKGKPDELVNGQKLDFSAQVAAVDISFSSGARTVMRRRLPMPGYPELGSDMDAAVVRANDTTGVEVKFLLGAGGSLGCRYLVFSDGAHFTSRVLQRAERAEDVLKTLPGIQNTHTPRDLILGRWYEVETINPGGGPTEPFVASYEFRPDGTMGEASWRRNANYNGQYGSGPYRWKGPSLLSWGGYDWTVVQISASTLTLKDYTGEVRTYTRTRPDDVIRQIH